MDNVKSKKKPRPTAYTFTWMLKQELEDLKGEVTAIIDTIMSVDNGKYKNILDDKLKFVKETNAERRKKNNKKPQRGTPEQPKAEGVESASDNQQKDTVTAARRFQF